MHFFEPSSEGQHSAGLNSIGSQFAMEKKVQQVAEDFLTTEETETEYTLKFKWHTPEDSLLRLDIALEPLAVRLIVTEEDKYNTYEASLQLSKKIAKVEGITFRRVNEDSIHLIIPRKNFLLEEKTYFSIPQTF